MMFDEKPFIVRRADGEYSTVQLPDGSIETCWFGKDGSSEVIGREYVSKAAIAEKFIHAYEQKAWK